MNNKEFNDNLKLVFWSTVVVVATVTFFAVLYLSSLIVLSALIGLGTACLITPIVDHLEQRFKIPRFVGTLSFLILIGLFFLGLFYTAGSILIEQLASLKEEFPEIAKHWEVWWNELIIKFPLIGKLFTTGDGPGLGQALMNYVGLGISAMFDFFTGLSLAVIIALFSAANSKRYYYGSLDLLQDDQRESIRRKAKIALKTLRKWFYAQFIDMCVVWILTTIGLWIVGIKYWALYGFMAGTLSIIPYAGLMIVLVFSGAIVAVVQIDKFFWLLGVFAITQQIEGNFIMPKLMKDMVQVPAAPLIFMMILVGSWFGMLGVLVTPPLMAIAIAIYEAPLRPKGA